MRLFTLAICCAVLATSFADPDPKKYKPNVKKNKTNNTLTSEEKEFLRDVEAKFGIKPEIKDKKEETESKPTPLTKLPTEDIKLPFPAVIAIEIVNDTDSKTQGKGKRTIDANLGYGYKTNNGYSYSYFGKPTENKGKFMIYPYSQEDIPPVKSHITNVEITPSKAFELVPEQKEAYHYPKPATELQTEENSAAAYSNHGSPQGHAYIPSTLYTTYNGHELSGLSGQFPTVMPNYLVDPNQLLTNPEYQNVGLTDDHLRPHGSNIADQRVVPVLVLRIPSSSLKNPTAELFANLPSNYPLSRYLNNVNLQGLVNQYFQKQGYSFAPQVTHYQSPLLTAEDSQTGNYAGHNYATQHVQPSYTQSHNSGVQYSAVQPVMAKYPSSYPHHMNLPHGHKLYQQPQQQQKYEYRYQYVPQHVYTTHQVPQTYYVHPQQQHQTQEVETVPETNQQISSAEGSYEQQPHVVTQQHYEVPSQQIHANPAINADSYDSKAQIQSHEAAKVAYEYLQQHQEQIQSASPSYEHLRGAQVSQQYYTQEAPQEKETKAIYQSHVSQEAQTPSHLESSVQYQTPTQVEAGVQYQTPSQEGVSVQYQYQQQSSDDASGLVLAENYPSKDHTIATVLPVSYTAKQPSVGVQTVSYVTPMPYSSKYQSPYRIMVPQTFLGNPSTERVTYVDSHSVSAFTHPSSQQAHNPEAEYTLGPHHIPPIGKQKPPPYPRNYHSHKRMTKPEMKHSNPMHSRKHSDRNEKRKS